MEPATFSQKDLDQIRQNGQTPEMMYSHLSLFHRGTPFVNLDRPCTIDDGIIKLSPDRIKDCIHLYNTRAVHKKILKFIPASGAATRMFKTLTRAFHASEADHQKNEALFFFINNCYHFAFYEDLKQSLANRHMQINQLIADQNAGMILKHLLDEAYLNYAMLPKGLIKFHAYGNRSRTAFEEHLVEAGAYAKTADGKCVLHFTVATAFLQKFQDFFDNIRSDYEKQLDTHFDVSFSCQQNNSDTLAVDSDNQPFRRPDGRLLFRPGGHGALIHNLDQIDGDMIFIKNIDNVAHERFTPEMIEWKKILCGYLFHLQQQVFSFLNQLHQETISDATILSITEFLKNILVGYVPETFASASAKEKIQMLIDQLNRPIRVCGMVPNTGEPGGGPFWARDSEKRLSRQIIEKSQINTGDSQQAAILNGLTHFNPVDLVCGIRNWQGERFNLSQYIDHQAVFISNKSFDGRKLKALELPGLWNGAMAFWNTVFVEVPEITFNPVKEVSDLLNVRHQPANK